MSGYLPESFAMKKKTMKKEVVKHLKDDMKDSRKEIYEDKMLVKKIKKDKDKKEKESPKKHEKKEHDSKKKQAAHKAVIEKAMKHPNKLGAGAKKRKHLSPKDKKEVVMKEFKAHKLHSGSGQLVHDPKQAIAIAFSEARKAAEKREKRKKK